MGAFRVLLVCLQAALSFGYPNGAPPTACETLLPRHPNTSPQTSPSHYKISASSMTYSPNTPLTVTLYNENGNSLKFVAFLLQARARSNNQKVGQFKLSAPQTKLLSCGSYGNSITHSATVARSKLQLTWMPPATDVGDIVFLGTVAESMNRYWGVIMSAPISAVRSQPPVTTGGTPSQNGGASGGGTGGTGSGTGGNSGSGTGGTGGGTGGPTGSSTRLSTHVTAVLGVYLYAVYAFSARW